MGDTQWRGEERRAYLTPLATNNTTMSLRARPALVGRRFLSVTGSVTHSDSSNSNNLPKLKHLYDWDWRAGWIRSSTSEDPGDPELQVLVVKTTTSPLGHRHSL